MWAAYARVSTQEQVLASQEEAIKRFCSSRSITYQLFSEHESSRKTRPVKQMLLLALRQGDYEGVIVYKLDRWGRSLSELALELKEFSDKGIGFVSVSDNIDFSTPSGKLQVHMLAAFAEFERDLIRERTIAGMQAAKAKGKHVGRPEGSKDKEARSKSGYYNYWAGKRKRDRRKKNKKPSPVLSPPVDRDLEGDKKPSGFSEEVKQ